MSGTVTGWDNSCNLISGSEAGAYAQAIDCQAQLPSADFHVYVPLMHMLAFLMCLKVDLGGLTESYLNTCCLKQPLQHQNVDNPLLIEDYYIALSQSKFI